MSDPIISGADPAGAERDQARSELFMQMVMQQANLALMLMGKIPHPQSGQVTQDLEGARMFIDQLEMLEEKTKGNLSKGEERLLKQTLMSLQLAFVEAAQAPASPAPRDASAAAGAATEPASESTPPSAATDEDAGKKKFSKKY